MQVLEQLRAVRLHSGPVEGSRGYLSQPCERETGTLLSCTRMPRGRGAFSQQLHSLHSTGS